MILVTGATGFVGNAIVGELCAAGYSIRILARSKERAQSLQQTWPASQIEIFVGDVLQPDTLIAAFKGVQAVIHLVGIILETRQYTYEQMHVATVINVIKACQFAGVKRYVHMSALGTRQKARSRYHQTKWAGEEIVRKSGLNWTIFRPSLIYGSHDKFINFFNLFLKEPVAFLQLYTIPNIGGGRNQVQPVAVEDVARAFTRSLGHSMALGRVYDLCGPTPMTMRQLLLTICQARGIYAVAEDIPWRFVRRFMAWIWAVVGPLFSLMVLVFVFLIQLEFVFVPLFFGGLFLGVLGWGVACRYRETILQTIPFFMAFPLARIFETFWAKPPLSCDQLRMLQEDNIGDSQPAAKEFGLKQESLLEGIQRYLS
jgi:uncharacterized protein YbjT (DUF2867 family)